VRRRVLQTTIATVSVAVVLLGLPLAFLGAYLVRQTQVQEIRTAAASLGREVDQRIEQDVELDEEMLVPFAQGQVPRHVTVLTPDGYELSMGHTAGGPRITAEEMSLQDVLVGISVSWWEVSWLSARVLGLVVAAALVAFAASIALAIWQSDRLSAPLVYLAASAEQLGSGQVRPHLEPSGVEEIDLVASELARSADRMAGRLAAERQLAADASHQLRTPLTALSMRLEEIMMTTDDDRVRTEARICLEQVERLVAVVGDLLTNSRKAGGTTEAVSLAEVLHQQVEEWSPTFAEAGRQLVIGWEPGVEVLATPGALAQVLATLIENSLKHGGGTTTVSSRPGTSRSVVIEVGDEGAGVSDDLAPQIFERNVTSGAGTGLGLALARDLVSADGGRLELAQRRPAVFALFLAKVPAGMRTGEVLPHGAVVAPRPERRRR